MPMAELKIISMDEVAVEEVEWLWYPYIPYCAYYERSLFAYRFGDEERQCRYTTCRKRNR